MFRPFPIRLGGTGAAYFLNWRTAVFVHASALNGCPVRYIWWMDSNSFLTRIMRDVLRAGTGTCPYKNLMNRSG